MEIKPIQTLNSSLLVLLMVIFSILIIQYYEFKTVLHQSEKDAISSLLQIYDAEWKWYNLDIDENSIPDFWTRDVAGLFYYNRHQTGDPAKFISNEIARADYAPFKEFYLGKHFEKVPYKGYFFKMALYDVNGFYQAKKDPATNLTYCNETFCVIAYPASNRNLHAFLINTNKRILSRKVEDITMADKWPKDPIKEGWQEVDLK